MNTLAGICTEAIHCMWRLLTLIEYLQGQECLGETKKLNNTGFKKTPRNGNFSIRVLFF